MPAGATTAFGDLWPSSSSDSLRARSAAATAGWASAAKAAA